MNISETNSIRNGDSNDNFNDMLKKFNILDTHDSSIISRKNSVDTMSEVIYSGYDKKINDLKKEIIYSLEKIGFKKNILKI